MKLEFVIPTYKNIEALILILQSLIVQTNPNWKASVIIDGYNNSYDAIKQLYKKEDRITFTNIDGPNNDCGITPRNYGLEQATEEWVLMSGDDNYYVPHFVNLVLSTIDSKTNFVYCDMIHNGYEYKPFICQPLSHHIDIGNMIMRTQFAKQLRLDTTRGDSDGIMCTEYINKFCADSSTIKKINSILYVHN